MVISDPSDFNIHVVGEDTPSKEMTLCRARSSGVLGRRSRPGNRSRTYQPPDRTQARRDQAAVRQLTDTKRDIDLVIQEMRDPVGEDQAYRDFGKRG